MQKQSEFAGLTSAMPPCTTRYERGSETVMIQDYANDVRLIVNLDTERSQLMLGDKLYQTYAGTDFEAMRRMTAAATSLSITKTRHKSSTPDHILS